MRTLSRTWPAALLALAAIGPARADDAVALKDVSYADLGRTIRGLQGQVVVVDLWGIT